MNISFVTKSGAIGTIDPAINRSGLGADNTWRMEIQRFSSHRRLAETIDQLFATGETVFAVCVNYPEQPHECELIEIARSKSTAVYRVDLKVRRLDALFHSLRQFRFGEFCLFASRVAIPHVVEELRHMRKLDVLEVLKNKNLHVCALIGLDVESDIGTLASDQENLFYAQIEAIFEP